MWLIPVSLYSLTSSRMSFSLSCKWLRRERSLQERWAHLATFFSWCCFQPLHAGVSCDKTHKKLCTLLITLSAPESRQTVRSMQLFKGPVEIKTELNYTIIGLSLSGGQNLMNNDGHRRQHHDACVFLVSAPLSRETNCDCIVSSSVFPTFNHDERRRYSYLWCTAYSLICK